MRVIVAERALLDLKGSVHAKVHVFIDSGVCKVAAPMRPISDALAVLLRASRHVTEVCASVAAARKFCLCAAACCCKRRS